MTKDVWQVLARRVKVAQDRARRHGGAVSLEYRSAVDSVHELYELRRLVDRLIDDEIIRGRELGAPWELLGTSKQQAQQRHARAVVRQRALTNRRTQQRETVNEH